MNMFFKKKNYLCSCIYRNLIYQLGKAVLQFSKLKQRFSVLQIYLNVTYCSIVPNKKKDSFWM